MQLCIDKHSVPNPPATLDWWPTARIARTLTSTRNSREPVCSTVRINRDYSIASSTSASQRSARASSGENPWLSSCLPINTMCRKMLYGENALTAVTLVSLVERILPRRLGLDYESWFHVIAQNRWGEKDGRRWKIAITQMNEQDSCLDPLSRSGQF